MKRAFLFTAVLLLSGLFADAQTQYYDGTLDGDKINAQITWKSDKTISGSYHLAANPSRVFKLTGTNYVDGEIEVVEYFKGAYSGRGTLYKQLTKGRVTWRGVILNKDGTESEIFLTRLR
jgi:hypothetical protein